MIAQERHARWFAAAAERDSDTLAFPAQRLLARAAWRTVDEREPQIASILAARNNPRNPKFRTRRAARPYQPTIMRAG
jgi:hypothetical protein